MKHTKLFVLFILAVVSLTASSCGGKAKGELIAPNGGVFTIDASDIGKGEVRFFRREAGGKPVVFMVARDEYGDIKTAFDACITCYPHKQGYRVQEDSVVCIYCGNTFRIESLDKGIGNCMPIKIEHTMDGVKVIIRQQDIDAGAKWF